MENLHRNLETICRDALTLRQKELIGLHYDHGMTVREISRQKGVSASTVSRTLARAKERLRHTTECCR